MNVQALRARVAPAPAPADAAPRPAATALPAGPFSARLSGIEVDGTLVVLRADGTRLECDWLAAAGTLELGDELLLNAVDSRTRPVVMGRIGPYVKPLAPPAMGGQEQLTLEATQSLTLKCGESSIDLHADGRVMIRGDDVLVRAKGTQRIRAGSVSIN